jgi:hypothetical protein
MGKDDRAFSVYLNVDPSWSGCAPTGASTNCFAASVCTTGFLAEVSGFSAFVFPDQSAEPKIRDIYRV